MGNLPFDAGLKVQLQDSGMVTNGTPSYLSQAIGLVLTPMYLLSMCRRIFFGPRIPALASVEDMRPRELVIGLSLLVPTLVIGIWPRIAMDLYEASTDAIALPLLIG